MEARGHDIIEVLSLHLPGGPEEHDEIPQDNWYRGRNSNRAPPEYKLRAFPDTKQLSGLLSYTETSSVYELKVRSVRYACN
jgi:hypothetical protein